MKPSIASVLKTKSSPLTKSLSASGEPDSDEGLGMGAEESDMDGDGDAPSPEEISAIKLFERAGTAEEKATALRMFVKACMPDAY